MTVINIVTLINIIAIILSPIIALFISHRIQINYEKRKEKIEILKTLMARRVLANSIEYVNALNTIDIIFADSPKVKAAYKDLYEAYNQPNFDISKSHMMLTKLIESIVVDVGYKEKITWDAIQQPYYPVWLNNQIQADSTIKEYNLAIASSALYGYQQQENNKG